MKNWRDKRGKIPLACFVGLMTYSVVMIRALNNPDSALNNWIEEL